MEHLYIICYDIRNQKRWRRVYRKMKGYGEWVQLSVFQCRLNRIRFLRLESELKEIIVNTDDHVLFFDLGPADQVKPRTVSLGKTFTPEELEPVIV
ncbi:MAG TPA: CRISPR-associated endonuclease Cas2 [Dissulfurispiraceae bacterium]|nr:CRISPR-associated endonuclease Cas2 [Dissulfurispiraceae bacterium]